jgi:hypothetical protein
VGSPKAAILAAVGVLKGRRFNGGKRKGCRFFFFVGVAFAFCSMSDSEAIRAFLLVTGSGSILVDSRTEADPENSFVELLFLLLESNGRLDFRLKNGCSAGDSLGDSYALGIAGTGGTSSSSLPAELCTFLGLGVGNLELEIFGGSLGCKDPVDVLAVLKLAFEPMERPELYDLRLISGVVREDDGVGVFRGSMEGERDLARPAGI